MPSYDRALWALRTWLDSWAGIGHVAVGMHRQGYDLQLTQYDERGGDDFRHAGRSVSRFTADSTVNAPVVVVRGQDRGQKGARATEQGARATERDPARGVVQLTFG